MLVKPLLKNSDEVRTVNPITASKLQKDRRPILTISYDDESRYIYDYAFPVHQSEQVPATFFVHPSRVGTGESYHWGPAETWERLKEMDKADESHQIKIENHSMTHTMLDGLNMDKLIVDFTNAKRIFEENGISTSIIAYPGGRQNELVRHVSQNFFIAGRGISNSFSDYNVDPFNISSYNLDSNTLESLKAKIDTTKSSNRWLDFYGHCIHPDGEIDRGGTKYQVKTPDELREIIQYAKSQGVEVVSYKEAIQTFCPIFYWADKDGNAPFRINRNGTVVSA